MCNICKSLTDDYEDLCHDLCEYFLTGNVDIVDIHNRGKFLTYVCSAALRRVSNYKIKDSADIDLIELNNLEPVDTDKIIKGLSDKDILILTIFGSGATLSEVSRKVMIDRHTLKKHLDEAKRNAKRLIE